uniref:Uncharacterized protein n=1 Tax=Cyanothece sp. (strain PCC 7425 / ATCC 29141) TaxID=395961 RepID=B8HPD1_CYAP4
MHNALIYPLINLSNGFTLEQEMITDLENLLISEPQPYIDKVLTAMQSGRSTRRGSWSAHQRHAAGSV